MDNQERVILHVDMDAFFAAIEQRDNPDLIGNPVVIGADPKAGQGRGVVSTCSYEARKYGIHSAMPISTAYRHCPEAVFLPVNMRLYTEVSGELDEIFREFTPLTEKISIDEAFLDIGGSWHLFGSTKKTAVELKKRVKERVGLTASIGIAPNKFVAKIASDFGKPDGLVMVDKEDILDFLTPLDISKMWGAGKKTTAMLRKMNINTIGDIASRSKKELHDIFGKQGRKFWNLANGIDNREVVEEHDIKSVSNEITFSEDTDDIRIIENRFLRLSEKVSRRLNTKELKGNNISIKLRTKNFKTYTRAVTLDNPVSDADTIFKWVKKLVEKTSWKKSKVRLIGVRVSGFGREQEQMDLFANDESIKKESVNEALHQIRNKYGDSIIYRSGRILKKKDI
ncbi:DNA polymerase IV [Elusimicrobiota bacterium]